MTDSALVSALTDVFGDSPFEISEGGVSYHRNKPPRGSLREVEALLLAGTSVRVLDFNDDAALLDQNVVSDDGDDPGGYEGVATPSGNRVFRVDHHYPLACLAKTTTTHLTVSWLRGLWRREDHALVSQVAGSRYVANHADVDILLSNYLAGQASRRDLVFGRASDQMVAASMRNDHIEVEGFHAEAQRVFYACLGMEEEILEGRLSFAEAQSRYLPALERWVFGPGAVDPSLVRRLEGWEIRMRDSERRTLEAIAACEAAGGLTWEAADQLVVCEMPSRVDNADLYVYLARGKRRPAVQVLVYPEGSRFKIKIRSHGGFDLNPLFARLNERMPDAGFGGRATAGGSKSVAAVDRKALVDTIAASIRDWRES